MGDLIEFSTSSSSHNQTIYYKLTSSAITFEIKGDTFAAVGLARQPVEECNTWILVDYDEIHIVINGKTPACVVKSRNNILDPTRFRRFWLSWHNNWLLFGRNIDTKPLISKKLATQDLQYVTFTNHPDRALIVNLEWKVFIPPKLERPLCKKITNGEAHWIKADNQLPDGALIGGYEDEILYIIRAPHRGSLTPGKFVPSDGVGYIPWGGEMHESNEFEVLCGYNCVWVNTCNDKIPLGAIEGGYSENDHEKLYVGRASHHHYLIPGKVQPSHSVCYIPVDDQEVAKKQYEILVNPQIYMESINRCYVTYTDFKNLFDTTLVFEDGEDEIDISEEQDPEGENIENSESD